MKHIQQSNIFRNSIQELPQDQRMFAGSFEISSQEKIDFNATDMTQSPEQIISGEWRTNIMLDDPQTSRSDRALALRHLTSFEQKSMEDHGNRLKSTLEEYVKFVNKRVCPEFFQIDGKNSKVFYSWEDVQEGISNISNLSVQRKNILIRYCQRNNQALLILRQILNNIHSSHIKDCLTIAYHLFNDYEVSSVQKMDEDQIETYVSLNFSKIAEEIKEDIENSAFIPTDFEAEHQYEELIGSWMETFYLALNGVFQNFESRKSPLCGLEQYQTFCTSEKLTKLH